jgi:hypothetical protein
VPRTKDKAPTQRRLVRKTLRRSLRSADRLAALGTDYQAGRAKGMAYFELAHAPLRQERQGPGVGRRALPQVERPDLVLTAEDLPPSVQRARHYRAVVEPAVRQSAARTRPAWRGTLVLVDAVLALLAWGSRPWTG